MKKPELLIPAGSLEVLKTAVNFGADAVYIGGEAFGLRAKAKNFSPEDMAEGIAYAHDRGVKVYVTANILAHNGDLEAASDYFMELKHLKTKDGRPVPPDALIISDPGLFMIAKRVCPEIELHISTQANSTNYETWLFWWNLGAKRVVSARELSLAELAEYMGTPSKLTYIQDAEAHREWELTDGTVIAECLQAVKKLEIGEETDERASDVGDTLIFTFADGSTWRLEFEAGNLRRNERYYKTEGWNRIRLLLKEKLEGEGML